MKRVLPDKRKKHWPFHVSKDEAISPVIAAILMVAVTVVLAATVWLIVSYYNPSPVPLLGTLTEETTGPNSTTLMLILESPATLKDASLFHLEIINTTEIGSGWSALNATITNPDGSAFFISSFSTSGNIWDSSSPVALDGTTTIQSKAMILIIFHSDGAPVVLSDLKVVITYSGTTGSIPITLTSTV